MKRGYIEVAQRLQSKGAEIKDSYDKIIDLQSKKSEEDFRTLKTILETADPLIIPALIQGGVANINATDSLGRTILHEAVINHPEKVEALINSGVDLNVIVN